MQYTVEIARPVYRRTECYGEGLGLDDAVKAAQETAGQASADLAEVVRGEPFVAAMRLDGKPVEAPCDYTEYTLLKWAAELERFLPEQNVLGSKCPDDGAFQVRAGCAERTYERTIVQVDRAGDTAAARLALADLHHRQPVIVEDAALDEWLEPTMAPERLLALAQTSNEGPFDRWAVSPRVNNARNDDADLLGPLSP